MLQNRGQGRDERVTAFAQFMQTLVDDALQGALAPREQDHTKLPMIANARRAPDISPRLEPIDQTHGAVMAEKQALGQAADAGIVRIGKSANGQQHLVLLRLEAGGLSGVIAAAEELPDPVAEFGQRGVFSVADSSFHSQIIS